MKVIITLMSFFLPTLLMASANPDKLYTHSYDGLFNNFGKWNFSFFRKGTDVVSLDWSTKKEMTHKCNLPAAEFAVYQLSQEDALYLLVQDRVEISDGWILDLNGTCFKVSDLVDDFPSDRSRSKLFYSNKTKQLVIVSHDYKIAPTDGRINVFVDPKAKTIVKKIAGNFSPGLFATQFQSTAVAGQGRFFRFYNTDSFTLEKTVDFGELYFSKIYLEESFHLGLKNQYLVSGAEKNKEFLAYYDKSTDQLTRRFDTNCYEPELSIENNLAFCFDTTPGVHWRYYSYDLTTGEKKLIWDHLYHQPIFSPKNTMLIANKQNGKYSFHDVKTNQKTEIYTQAKAGHFFFLDKEEQHIISVSNNWGGKVEIEKFSISNPSNTQLLYTLDLGEGGNTDDVYAIFNAKADKLFVRMRDGNSAYYLDIK